MKKSKHISAPHRVALRNFLQMLFLFIPIILAIVLSVFFYSANTIQLEFMNLNLSVTQSFSVTMDQMMRQIRHITASLLTDDASQLFFSNTSLSAFPHTINGINSQIKAFLNTYSAVDRIYVYSPARELILIGDNTYHTIDDTAIDLGWLSDIVLQGPMQLLPRRRSNSYPFALSFMRSVNLRGYDGSVVVDINAQKLGEMLHVLEDETHTFYILTAEGLVLYCDNKQDLLEDRAAFADLAHFKADGSSFSKLVELDGKMYVWSQTYNENLEEYFVYKTYLPEYTVRLDTLHGIIFAATTIMLTLFIGISIYMTINALNPLRQLEHVLDKGNTLPSHKDEYTAYLIQRIMSQLQNDIKMKEALTDQLILIEKTQLRSLRSQINPHLLFNTLNAVSVMISVDMGNQQRAIDMIRWLSEMLRYSLDKEDTVPLATEVMQTRNYLHLLLARYDDDFSVQFHVEAGLEHAATPRLIMQPIIENAVFHGIVPLETRRGVLQIDIHREEPWLCISIKDNGVGMPPETVAQLQASLEAVPRELPEKHIGILNVAMRMHLTYPDAPPICVTSVQDEMTCFMLKIPLQKIEHA